MTVAAAIATGGKRPLIIKLVSDSSHLVTFFRGNWQAAADDLEPDAIIYAMRGPPESYGVQTDGGSGRVFLRGTNTVCIYGSEYYGNLKITVRGLCSELGSRDQVFVHGCSLSVESVGILLLGASGAGKTTITAALRRRFGPDVKTVNDDWGPVRVADATAVYTGETALHMKYRSVRAIAPQLSLSPILYPSENFEGDPDNPHARLLIPRETVFGQGQVASSVAIDKAVLLVRSEGAQPGFRRISAADLASISASSYSSFYDRPEPFFNGSLFLTTDECRERHEDDFARLLNRIPLYSVANAGDPERVAELIMELPV
jgi:hypothetical protein